MPQVFVDNDEYIAEDVSAIEKGLLHKQLFKYIAANNAFLADLFEDNFDNILAALGVAKHELKAPFAGMGAGDSEIALQMIRPHHVVRSTSATETAVNDWTVTFTADGDYWIGFDTNNTTAINVDRRVLLLTLAVWWTQGWGPITEELLIQLGNTTYPVQIIRHGWVGDNKTGVRAARIRPQIWKPLARPLVQTYQTIAGDQQMVLVGVAFAKGDLARQQAPTAIQV